MTAPPSLDAILAEQADIDAKLMAEAAEKRARAKRKQEAGEPITVDDLAGIAYGFGRRLVTAEDLERARAVAVHLEGENAALWAGWLGPALKRDAEALHQRCEESEEADFAGCDRPYLDGVQDALAWVLGHGDQPEIPEPLEDDE